MASLAPDTRTPERRRQDELLAESAPLAPPALPDEAVPTAMETHQVRRRPVAVAGVVENGLVRPLDPAVRLPEHARVIIVSTEKL